MKKSILTVAFAHMYASSICFSTLFIISSSFVLFVKVDELGQDNGFGD